MASTAAGEESKVQHHDGHHQVAPLRTLRRTWSSNSSSCGHRTTAAPKCVCAPPTHAGSFKCRLHWARLAELPEEERQVVARRDEIFHTIIGQDGHGYTLTYGTGIPRSTVMRAESSGCSSSQGSRLRTDEEVAELIQSLHQQMDARVEDLRVRMQVAMQAEVQAQVQEQVQAFKAELQHRLAQSGVPMADDSDPPIHTQAPDAGSSHQARHESVGEGMPDPAGSNEQNRVICLACCMLQG